jgi:hypothetical protein
MQKKKVSDNKTAFLYIISKVVYGKALSKVTDRHSIRWLSVARSFCQKNLPSGEKNHEQLY